MEVKKALTRLRRTHRADTEGRNVAAYYHLLHSSPQSSQVLHAVKYDPLPKAVKAVIAVVAVGVITGAVVGAVMLTKMISQAILSMGSGTA
ncbi:hypothetical protein DVH05_018470 [Phytophthora capsici]|nr:hypothetical protein DVH05_018470 [Phytophthora capsici]